MVRGDGKHKAERGQGELTQTAGNVTPVTLLFLSHALNCHSNINRPCFLNWFATLQYLLNSDNL